MRKEFLPSLLLTVLCILFFSGFYPLLMWGVAQLAPNKGEGFVVSQNDKVYYKNIAQNFTGDKYFWPRPSAVAYNAAGSGGSNKGPSNPDYLASVEARIDTFLVHNQGVKRSEISSDMVTASGSGLDPDISVASAMLQVQRVAHARQISAEDVKQIVNKVKQGPLLSIFGPGKVNVLELNIKLDQIKQ
ncbi:MAG: K(+)-transporting ATPase subunit C [Bacteroidetes bacterium]|nr:K(+)-transporting ATPase subunit C [Bacteroidota bacterium]